MPYTKNNNFLLGYAVGDAIAVQFVSSETAVVVEPISIEGVEFRVSA